MQLTRYQDSAKAIRSGVVAFVFVLATTVAIPLHAQPEVPVYQPPAGEDLSPARILGSTNRGAADESLSLAVLAPDHTGLTVQAQPTLYWYVSQPVKGEVVVTVQGQNDIDPLLEIKRTTSLQAGIVALPMRSHAASLETGVEYNWSVSINSDSGSNNTLVTSGVIKRVAASRSTTRPSDTATNNNPLDAARSLASNGIWYDAIDTLSVPRSNGVNASLGANKRRHYRAALLRQVNLPRAASHDERAAQGPDQQLD